MRIVTAFLLICLLAVSAMAGTIMDIRTGVIAVGNIVDVSGAVVTAVQNSSFTVTELPAGPYTAIWVYQGSAPTVSVGDVVDIRGLVLDRDGRSELSLLYPADAGYAVTGSAAVPEFSLSTLDLEADHEGWESHVVTITDGMIVQELLGGGLWLASSVETQLPVVFSDYFYDFATVDLGDCYNNAYGMVTWFQDQWVFKVISTADTDCTVGNQALSFGAVKTLFR